MNVLIDLSPVRSGGGLQLALNYLLSEKNDERLSYYIILNESLKKNPLIGQNSIDNIIGFCPNNIIKRYIFEYIHIPSLLIKYKIAKIFTFFGSGLPRTLNTRTIVGVAYPIICYPNSPYWNYIPIIEKIKKRLWNKVRINRLEKADIIIVETEIMKLRLLNQLSKNKKEVIVFPPTVSNFISEKNLTYTIDEKFNILILSGLAYHKNNWRLYDVACYLNKKNIQMIFTCSFNKEDFIKHLYKMLNVDIDNSILSKYFNFVGPVAPEKINSMYENSHALMNLSDLESFSNNYMEAWKASVLLICSDRDFSRAICRDSALYCEPHCIESVGETIIKAMTLKLEQRIAFLSEGKVYLKQLPSISDKNNFIEKILTL